MCKLIEPKIQIPIFTYNYMKKQFIVYPTSFILDTFKKENFEYLLLFAKGSTPTEGNNNLLQYNVKEAFVCPYSRKPRDLNLLYRRSEYYNKLANMQSDSIFIAIRFVEFQSDNVFSYKDVTNQMIKLAKENVLLEAFS